MADRTCTVDGCDNPILIKSRGWCSAHYAKWRKYGDPLVQRTGRLCRKCQAEHGHRRRAS